MSSNADKDVSPESGERDINHDSFEMVDIEDFSEIGNHDNAPPLATLQQTSNSETIVIPESTRDLQNWYNITSDITTTCKVEVQKLISRLQEPNRTISQDTTDQALGVLRLIYNPEASLLDKNIVDSVKKNKSMIALEILSFLHDSLTKALCTDELTLQQECAEEWAGKVMENLQLIWDFILECMSNFKFTRETHKQAFEVSHYMEIMKTWFNRVDTHKYGDLNGNDEDLAQTTSETNAAIRIWRTGHNTFEQSVKDVLKATIYLLVLDNCGCTDTKNQLFRPKQLRARALTHSPNARH